MRPNRLQNALAALGDAMREVNTAIDEMRREHDPLASLIFVARRDYQTLSDTKSGKRHHLSARLSWQQACDLGFRGNRERAILYAARWGSLLRLRGIHGAGESHLCPSGSKADDLAASGGKVAVALGWGGAATTGFGLGGLGYRNSVDDPEPRRARARLE